MTTVDYMAELRTSWICEACGEEIPSGLMRWVTHNDTCRRNAPNQSIANHRYAEAEKARVAAWEKRWAPIWTKMTVEERERHFFLSIHGVWDPFSNVIYMGFDAMVKLKAYENEMLTKYEIQ